MKYMLPFVWLFVAIFSWAPCSCTGLGAALSPASAGRGSSPGSTAGRADEPVRRRPAADPAAVRELRLLGQAVTLDQLAEVPHYAYDHILDEYTRAGAAEANHVSVSNMEADAEKDRQVSSGSSSLAREQPDEIADLKSACRVWRM